MVMLSRLLDAILEDLERYGIVAKDKWAVFDPNPSASSEHERLF